MTEQDAAIAYAKAWNTLNCSEFVELLADDCCYESQYVFEALESKDRIKDYLIGKMKAVNESGSDVRAEVGKILAPDPGRPCVIVYQDSCSEVTAVVVFQVAAGLVYRYDLCTPEFFEFEKTGIVPN